MTGHMLSLYAQQHHAQIAQAVAIILGFLASHATALLTHYKASSRVKAAVALALSTVAGVVASVGWAPGQPWFDWVKAILFAIVSAHATWALKEVTGVAITENKGLGLGQPEVNEPEPVADPAPLASTPVKKTTTRRKSTTTKN